MATNAASPPDLSRSFHSILNYWSEERLQAAFRKQRQQHTESQCTEAAMIFRHCLNDFHWLCHSIARQAHLELPRHKEQVKVACKKWRCTRCFEEVKYRCINDGTCSKYSLPISLKSCTRCEKPAQLYCFYCQETRDDGFNVEPACLRGIFYSAQFIAKEERTAIEGGFAGLDDVQHWLSLLSQGRERYLSLMKDYGELLSTLMVFPEIEGKQMESVQYKTARKSNGRVLTVEVQSPYEICAVVRKSMDPEIYVKVYDVLIEWRRFLRDWQNHTAAE